MSVEIHIGDCLSVMQGMPDDSVDLIVCSPPYEDARTYAIDFSLKGQDWVDWCVERYRECVRVTRGLVVWVVEGRTREYRWSASPALLMADLTRAGIRLRKPPIFYRVGIPGSGGPDWWRNDYEFCVCSSKGKLPWSDNTATGKPPKWAPGGEMCHRLSDGSRRNQWGGSAKGGNHRKRNGSRQKAGRPSHELTKAGSPRKPAGSREQQEYPVPVKANPGNVIRCKVGGGHMGSPLAHENEAPFPESLVEPFVLSFCPPGGTVFDPFCGSGTTGAVALRLQRSFIGCDVRPDMGEVTSRRLQQVQSELFV